MSIYKFSSLAYDHSMSLEDIKKKEEEKAVKKPPLGKKK